MSDLLTNQLVEIPAEGVVLRILWVDPLGRGYQVIDVQSDTAFPVFRDSEELTALIEDGGARVSETDRWLAPLVDTHLPGHYRVKRDDAWALVSPLALNVPEIFKPSVRGKAVQEVVNAGKATKQTLYRLLRRYWQRGMVPNALLPDFARCGAPKQTRRVSEEKRRKRAEDGVYNAVITAEIRDIFRSSITRRFARKRPLDLRSCYNEVIADHFSDRVVNERTGATELVPRMPYPSVRQFRYWYEKDNDIFLIERLRRTPRVYDKDMRAIIGSSTKESIGPGFRYQIDATIGDVYLVSRFDRNKIIGRPVVYIVIDVFSRMITGVYIGLEGPSWVGAMMALANATSPKVEYCQQFDVIIEEADWPCAALPDKILGDRGEMASRNPEGFIKALWIGGEVSAPYRPDWKGIVEQRFRMIPAPLKPYVPGYVAPDFKERGGPDYRLDGTLDLEDFTEIFLRCVLYYNNRHVLKDYPLSPEMIADGVPPIPIELWHWGIVRRSGLLRSYPSDRVRMSLLPSDEATVTAQGIRFWSCFYSCSKALEEHWFERARQKGNWKVRVSYDPRLMDDIYVHEDAFGTEYICCSLTDASADYRGRSLWEIEQLRAEGRRQIAAKTPDQLEGRINLNEAIKNAVARAEQKTKAAQAFNTDSNSKRTKGIRGNRAAEKQANRPDEAFRFAKPEQPPATVLTFPKNQAADTSEPDITEILRSLEEGGDDDQ